MKARDPWYVLAARHFGCCTVDAEDRLTRHPRVLLVLVVALALSTGVSALPYEPKWGGDVERSAFALENRRGPDPIHIVAPVNPNLGLAGGRLEADGGAANGNYHLEIPLVSLRGRGFDLALSLYYNSQIWYTAPQRPRPAPPYFDMDADGDWPAPGAKIGFGKLVFPNSGMLIEADGTRIPLSPPDHESINGRRTGRVTAKFLDGSGRTVECPAGSDGCIALGHIARVKLANGRYTEFVSSQDRWTDTNVYYPQRLWDVHGNYIQIEYVRDAKGTPRFPLIDHITDTVGRVVRFHYDSRNLLVAITGPDLQSGTRTYARFSYRWLDIQVGVPGGWQYAQFWALDGIFFPGSGTGYVFDNFEPFGIPRTVSLNRDMSVTTSSLTEQGAFRKGTMTYRSVFNYPTSDVYMTNGRLPTYNQRTDTWADPITAASSTIHRPRTVRAVTRYALTRGPRFNLSEITYPDNSRVVQRSNSDRTRWDYGLSASTQWVGSDGTLLRETAYVWEQSPDGLPRQKEVRLIDHELALARKIVFQYGANSLQVRQEAYSDNVAVDQLPNAPVLMRKNRYFLDAPAYLDQNFNLPFAVTTDSGTDDSVYEETQFDYDTRPVQSLSADLNPGIAGYARNLNTFPNGPRGNLARMTRILSNDGGPIVLPPPMTTRISTDFDYDEAGNLRKIQPTSSQSATAYTFAPDTEYSLPSEVTTGSSDPASTVRIGQRTLWDVGLGLPTTIVDVNGGRTDLSWQPATAGWRLRTSTSPTGVTTTYDYEDKHLSLEVGINDGEGGHYYSAFRYDGRGLLRDTRVRLRERGGHEIVEYEYDEAGRLVAATLPRWTTERGRPRRVVGFTYDRAGRLFSRTEPDGSTTRWLRNDRSRAVPDWPTGVRGQTVLTQDAWSRERLMALDALGNLQFVLEPNPRTGHVSDAGGLLTEYRRDALGRITEIRQGPQVRRFRYDTLGRLTAAKYPERSATLNASGVYVGPSGEWSDVFTYDALSNPVGLIDARGVTARLDYRDDPLNRPQAIEYDLSGVPHRSNRVEPAAPVVFDYESSGDLRRLRATSVTGVLAEERRYDAFGRLLRLDTRFADVQGVTLTTAFTWDSLGRVRTMRYPSAFESGDPMVASTVAYRYSRDGELVGLDLDGRGVVRNAVYDSLGLRHLDLSHGSTTITEQYEHTTNGRIQRQAVRDARSGRTLLNLEYAYLRRGDGVGDTGQITMQTDLLDASRSQRFSYDGLGRLSSANVGDERSLTTSQRYTYDAHGNRVVADAFLIDPLTERDIRRLPPDQADGLSISIDAATNRISSPNYQYDAAGNLIQGPGVTGQLQRYVYDAAGRLVRVETTGGALIEAYGYGADRRRTGVSPNQRDWRLSVWIGNTELARYDKPESSGLTWREMPLYFGGRLLGDLHRSQQGIRLFHQDHRGVALVTRQEDGRLESTRLSMLPYGKELAIAARPADTPIFTTYERSAESGLDYAINRFYDPKQGRFVQTDPLGMQAMNLVSPQSLNLYSYVMSDPVNRIDPSGLSIEIVPRVKWACATWSEPGGKPKSHCESFTVMELVWVPDAFAGGSGGGGRGRASYGADQCLTPDAAVAKLEKRTIERGISILFGGPERRRFVTYMEGMAALHDEFAEAEWSRGNYGSAVLHWGVRNVEGYIAGAWDPQAMPMGATGGLRVIGPPGIVMGAPSAPLRGRLARTTQYQNEIVMFETEEGQSFSAFRRWRWNPEMKGQAGFWEPMTAWQPSPTVGATFTPQQQSVLLDAIIESCGNN